MTQDAALLSKCCTDTVHSSRLDSAEYRNRFDTAQARINSPTEVFIPLPDVVTIGVVVHNVYAFASHRASVEARIDGQIDALNRDYSQLASLTGVKPATKSVAAIPGIRFVLRDVIPAPAAKEQFLNDDSMKVAGVGSAAVDPQRFLNLWVCDLLTYAGYARFPGAQSTVDGVVIAQNAFGIGSQKSPQGKTATHEVGHWLGLFHLWGDGSTIIGNDAVNDTPKCTAAPSPMPENFMDYSDDTVATLFTRGQVDRMRQTLATVRTGLWT